MTLQAIPAGKLELHGFEGVGSAAHALAELLERSAVAASMSEADRF